MMRMPCAILLLLGVLGSLAAQAAAPPPRCLLEARAGAGTSSSLLAVTLRSSSTLALAGAAAATSCSLRACLATSSSAAHCASPLRRLGVLPPPQTGASLVLDAGQLLRELWAAPAADNGGDGGGTNTSSSTAAFLQLSASCTSAACVGGSKVAGATSPPHDNSSEQPAGAWSATVSLALGRTPAAPPEQPAHCWHAALPGGAAMAADDSSGGSTDMLLVDMHLVPAAPADGNSNSSSARSTPDQLLAAMTAEQHGSGDDITTHAAQARLLSPAAAPRAWLLWLARAGLACALLGLLMLPAVHVALLAR